MGIETDFLAKNPFLGQVILVLNGLDSKEEMMSQQYPQNIRPR